jgi:hypothetical protein
MEIGGLLNGLRSLMPAEAQATTTSSSNGDALNP